MAGREQALRYSRILLSRVDNVGVLPSGGIFARGLPAVAQSQAFATITIKPARSTEPRNAREVAK
jgi:hypothetical protein